MGTYTLSKAVSVPMNFRIWSKPDGKATRQVAFRMIPGEVYELPDDDALFVQDLKKQKQRKRYTPEIEAHIKSLGVDYEVDVCKTCGGKKKFIKYSTVEVEE